ncbi:DUF1461 domain-containing protein [Candidatus Woesearchaeota archaeon]|nr:DUF1461 domain-containing protein [Candidatus Woesearchaeota archaeon]
MAAKGNENWILPAIGGFLLFLILFGGSFLLHLFSYTPRVMMGTDGRNLMGADSAAMHGGVVEFLLEKSASLPPAYFSLPEREHMADVKNIFLSGKLAFSFLVIIFSFLFAGVVYFGGRKLPGQIGRIYLLGGAIGAIFSLSVLLFSLADFEKMFSLFHMPLFQAGTWEFPPDSMLIRLYPAEFFYWKAISIFISLFIIANLFIAEGVFLLRLGKAGGPGKARGKDSL